MELAIAIQRKPYLAKIVCITSTFFIAILLTFYWWAIIVHGQPTAELDSEESLRLKREQLAIEKERIELEAKQFELQKEQHELEKKKLELERDKEWWNVLVKILTVLITVGIGTYGVAKVNNSYQNRQLEQERVIRDKELQLQQQQAIAERRQAEMKYLGDFLKYALEENAKKRIRFAEYFATLTISEDLRERWAMYQKTLESWMKERQNLEAEQIKAERDGDFDKAKEYKKQRERMEEKLAPVTPKFHSEDDFREFSGIDVMNRPLEHVENDFEDHGDVVIDNATGLMWQKSGSDDVLTYHDAQTYLESLNRNQFAGYSDWRLPTVRELITLVEPELQPNERHIDPIFDNRQRHCWTSDEWLSATAWLVDFVKGEVHWYGIINHSYVRAVRNP